MKKFKAKKLKSKKIIYYILIIFLFVILNYIESNVSISIFNKDVIDIVLKSENTYSINNVEDKQLSNYVYDFIKDKIVNKPLNLLKEDKEHTDLVFSYGKNEKKDIDIYLYNSHQGETYSSDYLEEYNIVPDILMASLMLKDKLESIGINTIVEESDILKYMSDNGLDHAGSYIASRHFLISALDKYPNAVLYIDMHRDAIVHDLSTVEINGKKCAKILFVIGLEYNTYENNLSIVKVLNNKFNNKYPGLSRGIMKKEGYGVNGVYNQDLRSNIILIEIGGNENNIEEVNNTLDLVSDILGEYVNEKRKNI